MNILLTGMPDFLFDALTGVAKQRGHSVSRFTPSASDQLAALAQKYDVLIASAVGQSPFDSASLVPPTIQAASIALIIQDNQQIPAALPFTPSLTIMTDLLVGPGDPSGRLTYWAQRMKQGTKVLACGDPLRKLAPCIDVRDAAAWIIESVEARREGKFHLKGEEETIEELLGAARALAGLSAHAQIQYVSDEFLRSQNIQPEKFVPLWAPPGNTPASATTNGFVEVKPNVRPLKQSIHDALAAEDARKSQTDPQANPAAWLSPAREAALITEWPHYDPTGEKKRHLMLHAGKVFFGLALAISAAIVCFHDTVPVEKAVDAIRSADGVVLGILQAFHPRMLLDLYNTLAGPIFTWLPGSSTVILPLKAIYFIVAIVCATPLVFVGLFRQGGIINLVGGLITIAFGFFCWPWLSWTFVLLGRSFPRVLPQLESNTRQCPGAVVGRAVLSIAVPAFIFFYDYPPSGFRIFAAVVVALFSLYVVITLTQDKITEPNANLFGNEPALGTVSAAAIICMTLGMGFMISAFLQFALTKAIADVNVAITQLALAPPILAVAAFLDRIHVVKSLGEEWEHLTALFRLRT